jgi:hypothetical protein
MAMYIHTHALVTHTVCVCDAHARAHARAHTHTYTHTHHFTTIVTQVPSKPAAASGGVASSDPRTTLMALRHNVSAATFTRARAARCDAAGDIAGHGQVRIPPLQWLCGASVVG